MILIQIAGHLGADPETRMSPAGQKITTLRIATNIRRKNLDKTVWWRVTIFGDRFDKMLPYLKKGSAAFIIGSMNAPEIYQDKEGNSQVSLELVAEYMSFSPFGNKGDRQGQEGAQGAAQTAPGYGSGYDSENQQTGGAVPPASNFAFQPAQSGFQPRSFGFSGISQGQAKGSADMSDDDSPF